MQLTVIYDMISYNSTKNGLLFFVVFACGRGQCILSQGLGFMILLLGQFIANIIGLCYHVRPAYLFHQISQDFMCGIEVMLSSSNDTFHNSPDVLFFSSWLASLFSHLFSAEVSSESGLPYRDFSPPQFASSS